MPAPGAQPCLSLGREWASQSLGPQSPHPAPARGTPPGSSWGSCKSCPPPPPRRAAYGAPTSHLGRAWLLPPLSQAGDSGSRRGVWGPELGQGRRDWAGEGPQAWGGPGAGAPVSSASSAVPPGPSQPAPHSLRMWGAREGRARIPTARTTEVVRADQAPTHGCRRGGRVRGVCTDPRDRGGGRARRPDSRGLTAISPAGWRPVRCHCSLAGAG